MGIHVDVNLTRATYIVADQVHPFMSTALSVASGLSQQDNAPCHTAQMVWEWFEECDEEFKVLP